MEAVAMRHSSIEWGVSSLPLQGHTESGDGHMVQLFPGGALAAAIDGLGHGEEAAEAARIVVDTLEERPSDSVIYLLERCHKRLLGKPRGAVVTLASFNLVEENLTWSGIGNVDGILLRADPNISPQHESVVPRRGVVGGRLPSLHASVIPLHTGDTLILVTDGIRRGFEAEIDRRGHPQEIADTILAKCNPGTDDALVLVIRYKGADA